METFKLSDSQTSASFNWVSWLQIILGIIYEGLFLKNYFQNDLDLTSYLLLGSGLILIIIGTLTLWGLINKNPEIILNQRGITYGKKKALQHIMWPEVQEIHINKHLILVRLKSDALEKLNIAYVNYKQLQVIKQALEQFTSRQHIQYFSKY